MGFEQYHEPAGELSAEMRTFARMITSMTEEAEAIGWYQQRIALEPDPQAGAIMENAQGEEFKHFGMDLEFLLRRTPKWRIALQTILFTEGDIVESGRRGGGGREPLGRDDGIRTHDLLHGKRVVGSGLRAAEGLWLSGIRPLAAAFYLCTDCRRSQPIVGGLGTRKGLVP